jgi:hypothetical protein
MSRQDRKFLPIRLTDQEFDKLEKTALRAKKSPSGYVTELVLRTLGFDREVRSAPSVLKNLQYRRKARSESGDIDL